MPADRSLLLQLARAHQLQLHPAAAKTFLKFAERYDAADHSEVLSRLIEAAAVEADRVIDGARAEAAVTAFASRSTAAEGTTLVVASPPFVHADEARASISTVPRPPLQLADLARNAVRLAFVRESRVADVTRLRALEGQNIGGTLSVVGLLRDRATAAAPAAATATSTTGNDAPPPQVVTVEDADAAVEVTLAPGRTAAGLINAGTIVVATGRWTGKTLEDATLRLPQAEPRSSSHSFFGVRDYFGGALGTSTPSSATLCVMGHVDATSALCLEGVKRVMRTCEAQAQHLDLATLTFVFTGSFVRPRPPLDPSAIPDPAAERTHVRAPMQALAIAIATAAPTVSQAALFVFVPGTDDPTACGGGGYPLRPLSKRAAAPLTERIRRTQLASNPCRLRVGEREIVVASNAFHRRYARGALVEPDPSRPAFEHLAHTVAGQGTLWPSAGAPDPASPVDAALTALFPLPDLVCMCDATPSWDHTVEGCRFVNPGPFSVASSFVWCAVADGTVDFNRA